MSYFTLQTSFFSYFTRVLFILFFLISPLQGESSCSWPDEWRAKALIRLNTLVSKAVPFGSRMFATEEEVSKNFYEEDNEPLTDFGKEHGYFTCQRPLVGIVTDSRKDIKETEKALASLKEENNLSFVKLSTAEILAKVLAYRDLQKHMKVKIPVVYKEKVHLVTYEVDASLDLWLEMPAFGLLPKVKWAPPILLFRGTDLSLLSKGSWASILSDLDVSGVGFSVFQDAEKKIRFWLAKAGRKTKKKPVAIGFSLGGVLSMYTALFASDLLAEEGSFAFNPPGVSDEVFAKWNEATAKAITLYLTQGDLVSKLGKMVPTALVFSEGKHLGPIEAHTKLMTAESLFSLAKVAIEKENENRFRVD